MVTEGKLCFHRFKWRSSYVNEFFKHLAPGYFTSVWKDGKVWKFSQPPSVSASKCFTPNSWWTTQWFSLEIDLSTTSERHLPTLMLQGAMSKLNQTRHFSISPSNSTPLDHAFSLPDSLPDFLLTFTWGGCVGLCLQCQCRVGKRF